jgi:hypothetical protein
MKKKILQCLKGCCEDRHTTLTQYAYSIVEKANHILFEHNCSIIIIVIWYIMYLHATKLRYSGCCRYDRISCIFVKWFRL